MSASGRPGQGAGRIRDARSVLFVPADRPDRFAKALESGADEIVIDLEDAVAASDKEQARANVREWRAEGGAGVVRINDVTSEHWRHDIVALGDRPSVVMLPKASRSTDVRAVLDLLPEGSWVVPLIESAAGVLSCDEVCATPGVVRAGFGNGDLSRDLGISDASEPGLAYARSRLVVASAAAGIAAPIDGATTALDDEHALQEQAEHGVALGFAGKFCLHPRQVALVNRVHSPSPEDLRWARGVMAIGTGGVAVTDDGQFVDKPLLDRARQILDRAARA